MRVALSFDMEGISQVTSMRECLAASEEYWIAAAPRSRRT